MRCRVKPLGMADHPTVRMRADPTLGHFADAAASSMRQGPRGIFVEMHHEIPGASVQRIVEGVDVADMVAGPS